VSGYLSDRDTGDEAPELDHPCEPIPYPAAILDDNGDLFPEYERNAWTGEELPWWRWIDVVPTEAWHKVQPIASGTGTTVYLHAAENYRAFVAGDQSRDEVQS
jgi:hypothetical protein